MSAASASTPVSAPSSAAVPFFDWQALWAEHADDYQRIVCDTAATGGFILQAAVDAFEASLAAYLGVGHVIGVSDCTNAMLLGLRASRLRPGDEVILPGHGFIAAAQSIHFAGGTPVPVDLRDHDGLIDPDAIEAAVTSRTRAIMAVHVNGRVCDMEVIGAIAAAHGLAIYEDAAQALGARVDHRMAGRFGEWAAFSFYPSKTLGCFGDAGAIVTDNSALAATLRAMRNHGAGPNKAIPADCAVWGTNARIDNLHAAVLDWKLGWYERALARRLAIALRYHDGLAGLPGIDCPPDPAGSPGRRDIWQNYELCCDDRDGLRSHLAAQGIGTIVPWGGTALHQFAALGITGDLPRTDRWFRRAVLLPMNHLLNDRQVDRVIAAVRAFAQVRVAA